MSRFEYLSVLVSIVIALGISEVVSTWGRLLRNRARVRFYGLHAFWTLFVVVLMVQMWWGFWNFRTVESWTFLALLGVVIECIVMVLSALVLLPTVEAREPIDLRQHYFAQCRLFFLLGCLLVLQLTTLDLFVLGQPLFHVENAIRLSGAGVAALAAAFPNPRFHTALAALATVLFAGFVAFSFT
ncbi:MAG: hypothetical protein ABFS41_14190 [Myxococcota bacterium]